MECMVNYDWQTDSFRAYLRYNEQGWVQIFEVAYSFLILSGIDYCRDLDKKETCGILMQWIKEQLGE